MSIYNVSVSVSQVRHQRTATVTLRGALALASSTTARLPALDGRARRGVVAGRRGRVDVRRTGTAEVGGGG